MAPTPNDRTLEGLYILGLPYEFLSQLDPKLPIDAFRRKVNEFGITNQQIDQANGIVNWRAGGGSTWENLNRALETIGRGGDFQRVAQRAQELNPQQGMRDSNSLAKAMDEILGREVSGALRVKIPGLPTGGGNTPAGPVAPAIWNPYRGDKPLPGVEVAYGQEGRVTRPWTQTGGPAQHEDLPVLQPPGAIGGKPVAGAKPPPAAPAAGGTLPVRNTGGGTPPPTTTVAAPAQTIELPPALSKNATEEEIQKHVRQYYGFMSWGLDIPDIRQIVLDIAQNPSTKWTQEAVNGRVQATTWWQQNGINVQTWLQRRANDPATTQQEIRSKFEDFKATTKAAGIDIPDQRLWNMAEEALKWKWSEATVQAVIGSEYRFDPSKPTAQTQNVKKLASEYLVKLGDEATGYWTKQLLTGQKTEDEYKQYLVQQAKSMFPQLAGPLDRGEPLSVYLDSYKQRAAAVLEQDPDNIDFTEAKWMRLLTKADPKTGERRMMDLADVEQVIRTDPQYGYEYTKQAKDEAGSLAASIMKKMGVTA